MCEELTGQTERIKEMNLCRRMSSIHVRTHVKRQWTQETKLQIKWKNTTVHQAVIRIQTFLFICLGIYAFIVTHPWADKRDPIIHECLNLYSILYVIRFLCELFWHHGYGVILNMVELVVKLVHAWNRIVELTRIMTRDSKRYTERKSMRIESRKPVISSYNMFVCK